MASAKPGTGAKTLLRNEGGGDGRKQLEPAPGLTPPVCCCRCHRGCASAAGAELWMQGHWCGSGLQDATGVAVPDAISSRQVQLLLLCCIMVFHALHLFPQLLLPRSCDHCLCFTTESTSEAGTVWL